MNGEERVNEKNASGVGWKISSIVFGTSTVVLAILLSGQLAAPQIYYQSVPQATTTVTSNPEPTEAPQISNVSQLVGALGLVLMQNYSSETGWPEDVTVIDGKAVTAEGIELGVVPAGTILTYVRAADGSGFTLTVEDESGESAVFGPAAIEP